MVVVSKSSEKEMHYSSLYYVLELAREIFGKSLQKSIWVPFQAISRRRWLSR